MFVDTHAVVKQEGQTRQTPCVADLGEGREHEEEELPEQVVHQQEAEQRHQIGNELAEVMPEHVAGDAVTHEVVGQLAEVLPLAGDQLVRARYPQPEGDHQDGAEHRLEELIVDPVELRAQSREERTGAEAADPDDEAFFAALSVSADVPLQGNKQAGQAGHTTSSVRPFIRCVRNVKSQGKCSGPNRPSPLPREAMRYAARHPATNRFRHTAQVRPA